MTSSRLSTPPPANKPQHDGSDNDEENHGGQSYLGDGGDDFGLDGGGGAVGLDGGGADDDEVVVGSG